MSFKVGCVMLGGLLGLLPVAAGSAVAAERVVVGKVVSQTVVTTAAEVPATNGADMGDASVLGHGTVGVAPTEAQAEAAFASARRSYMAVASGAPDATVLGDDVTRDASRTQVVEDTVPGGKVHANVALENIRIVLDVDNVTLREVMAKIVKQAGAYTGPWTVKWRLRPENADLLDERVNLTAEANFGEFCDLLTERVKNMSGTQLYVTAFAATRVLLVADTYY